MRPLGHIAITRWLPGDVRAAIRDARRLLPTALRRVSPVRYVALLRGINVGGRTLVKMADLKACFENLGFDGVSTYIASGNVLFETDEDDAAELATTIETAIEQRFELPVKLVVLDKRAYGRIVKAIPTAWIGDGTVRANVAFVRDGTDAEEVIRELEPDAAIEEVKAVDGAILWATRRDSLNRSVMRKLIAGAAYKELTVRNLNTTLKLHDLLAGSGAATPPG
jgi:uncharacterized protein (DUF1697 family)